MPRRVDDYRGLTQKSRLRLLHAVQRVPGRRLQELAEEACVPVSTARDHLRVLEDEGLIASAPVDTGRRGRPPHGYSPVQRIEHSQAAERRAAAARARGDLLRDLAPELDHSDSLGTKAVHQLDALYEHLEDAGMEPELDEQELTVGLLPCLYEEMIDEERPLVCSVHAKLVRDQLAQVSGPLELRRLHPFLSPKRCVIVLALKGEAARSTQPGGLDGDCDDAALEQGAVRAKRTLDHSADESLGDAACCDHTPPASGGGYAGCCAQRSGPNTS
ncbi:helix-turn-helix domain-containing protein [Nesterenkonia sp. DZ6]|uniref:helix-turn-helix domain-containing protein n=1 Tax=Nesterenkonia sp. DZ6 TaxID=2901229 RepID=UPI0021064313|nr:ArsR family transcriptional regulator [Nesterenkonia sp. DZ6]